MAVLSGLKERGNLRWTKGLLVPERLRLRATAGAAGARAAGLLYQQRGHRRLASATGRARLLALTVGLGPRSLPPFDAFEELCELVGIVPVGAAAIQSWRADRLVLCIVGRRSSVIVKVGAHIDSGLAGEARMLANLDGSADGIIVPRVRWHGAWGDSLVLAMDALELVERRRSGSQS